MTGLEEEQQVNKVRISTSDSHNINHFIYTCTQLNREVNNRNIHATFIYTHLQDFKETSEAEKQLPLEAATRM